VEYRIDETTILSDEILAKTRGKPEEMFSGEEWPKFVRPSTGVFVGVVIIKVLLSTGVLVGMARAKSTGVRIGLARKD
jgi:hypothetical protein